MNLIQSPLSTPLRVTSIAAMSDGDVIARRLMELGFIQGAVVEIRHQAPLLHDPIAVLVRGMVVALRKYEAERVSVEALPTKET
jgi:ferrous iron transport protein A